MFVVSFPAGTFQTNCYLVAASPGAEALVVDPGQDAMAGVEELCGRHHLRPVAVLVAPPPLSRGGRRGGGGGRGAPNPRPRGRPSPYRGRGPARRGRSARPPRPST